VVANHGFRPCASRLTPHGVYITTLPRPGSLTWSVLTRPGRGRRAVITAVQPSAADLAYLAELVVTGRIKPAIGQVLRLADAPTAWAASRGGHVRGKLILSIDTTSL
jgi:NADPH:quinone reductase-like Zn-dependent oxidoreductase